MGGVTVRLPWQHSCTGTAVVAEDITIGGVMGGVTVRLPWQQLHSRRWHSLRLLFTSSEFFLNSLLSSTSFFLEASDSSWRWAISEARSSKLRWTDRREWNMGRV